MVQKRRKMYYPSLRKSESDFVNYFIRRYLRAHKKYLRNQHQKLSSISINLYNSKQNNRGYKAQNYYHIILFIPEIIHLVFNAKGPLPFKLLFFPYLPYAFKIFIPSVRHFYASFVSFQPCINSSSCSSKTLITFLSRLCFCMILHPFLFFFPFLRKYMYLGMVRLLILYTFSLNFIKPLNII